MNISLAILAAPAACPRPRLLFPLLSSVVLSCVVFSCPLLGHAAHGASAIGQPAPITPPPPAPTPAPASEPTLDELLGLQKAKPANPANPANPAQPPSTSPPTNTKKADAEASSIERELDGSATEKNDFEQAIDLMKESSRRLEEGRDAGVGTQRVQEQTLAKLDKLLDQARKQQSKKKSKSKQRENQDPKEGNQQPQQSSQEKQSQSQQQSQGDAGNPKIPAGATRLSAPPGAGAAWGNLPGRLRDALTQGSSEYTSAKWEALTREYYKRLAEQPGSAAPRRGDQP